jgi:hypothetical protein
VYFDNIILDRNNQLNFEGGQDEEKKLTRGFKVPGFRFRREYKN